MDTPDFSIEHRQDTWENLDHVSKMVLFEIRMRRIDDGT
jgi:hypothetical protein